MVSQSRYLMVHVDVLSKATSVGKVIVIVYLVRLLRNQQDPST